MANAMHARADAMGPGVRAGELDGVGRRLLEREGATSAPEAADGLQAPPASASTGRSRMASPATGSSRRAISWTTSRPPGTAPSPRPRPASRPRLIDRAGTRALQVGTAQAGRGKPPAEVGIAVGRLAAERGRALIGTLPPS